MKFLSLIVLTTLSATYSFAGNRIELESGASMTIEADKVTEVLCKNPNVSPDSFATATAFAGAKLYSGANCKAIQEAGTLDNTGTIQVSTKNAIRCETGAAGERQTYYLVRSVTAGSKSVNRALISSEDVIFE
jgi:hypothetical protein